MDNVISPVVSVIIPARNEQFLAKTIDDVFAKATGAIECVVVLDGYWPDPPLVDRPNLVVIHRGEPQGMRPSINSAASVAKGKFLMKTDAHCMFTEGFDEVLAADCDADWLVIPRRLSLDAENWTVADTGKSPVDYEFLSHPDADKDRAGIHGRVWNARAYERKDILVDDNMSFQGSCWFMPKEYFWRQGPLQVEGYGDFIQEPQELGLRTWLGGGRMVTNKKTTYHHLHKGTRYGRGYWLNKHVLHAGTIYSTNYWLGNRWAERKYDIEWLIEKFWPVPTWMDNWRETLEQYRQS